MDGIACKPALHMDLHVRLAKIAVAQATAMHAIQIKTVKFLNCMEGVSSI